MNSIDWSDQLIASVLNQLMSEQISNESNDNAKSLIDLGEEYIELIGGS